MSETIIVALIAFAGTLSGSYFAQRRSTALIAYRIEQLEIKVGKHNNLIERTYQLENRCDLQDEKMKVANHRIGDLEKEVESVE
jgi:hypothetical protein